MTEQHFTPEPVRPTGVHVDNVAPGVQLNSYIKRTPSEDGTYVIVETHSEQIEKIPQPLTPEERAAIAKADRIAFIVTGSLVAGFLALVGYAAWKDEKAQRERDADWEKRHPSDV